MIGNHQGALVINIRLFTRLEGTLLVAEAKLDPDGVGSWLHCIICQEVKTI